MVASIAAGEKSVAINMFFINDVFQNYLPEGFLALTTVITWYDSPQFHSQE